MGFRRVKAHGSGPSMMMIPAPITASWIVPPSAQKSSSLRMIMQTWSTGAERLSCRVSFGLSEMYGRHRLAVDHNVLRIDGRPRPSYVKYEVADKTFENGEKWYTIDQADFSSRGHF